MEKEIKIQVPDGYEIDKEKSTFERIVFKKVEKLDYKRVSEFLFKDKDCWCIGNTETKLFKGGCVTSYTDWDNSTTSEQLESILALNKLCNVAKYLNGDWVPSKLFNKWFICIQEDSHKLIITNFLGLKTSNVYFKTEELAQQAIEILGEEEIRKALTLNH